MTDEPKASKYFHGQDRYNCAQAIMRAFRDRLSVSEEAIKACRKFGGGRAEGGVCGAVHAAHMLIEDPEIVRKLDDLFFCQAGSVKCREIRKLKKLSCVECVDLTAEIMSELLD